MHDLYLQEATGMTLVPRDTRDNTCAEMKMHACGTYVGSYDCGIT